jgi:hypothetical protein
MPASMMAEWRVAYDRPTLVAVPAKRCAHTASWLAVLTVLLGVGASRGLAAATPPTRSVQATALAEAALGEAFDLHVSQSIRVKGESLTVTFERVVEDSRCPTGATCIWAGDAVVRLTLTGARGQTATIDLHTQSRPDADSRFGAYLVRLAHLGPDPRENGIPADQYVATLIVEKP